MAVRTESSKVDDTRPRSGVKSASLSPYPWQAASAMHGRRFGSLLSPLGALALQVESAVLGPLPGRFGGCHRGHLPSNHLQHAKPPAFARRQTSRHISCRVLRNGEVIAAGGDELLAHGCRERQQLNCAAADRHGAVHLKQVEGGRWRVEAQGSIYRRIRGIAKDSDSQFGPTGSEDSEEV